MKRGIAAVLAVLWLLSLSPSVFAAPGKDLPEEELAETVTITIDTAQAFCDFAAACALEDYSKGVIFVLTEDIDLSGTAYSPVPYFAGEFDGRGHTVTGLHLDGAGSRQGLFRRIGPSGNVHDLHVEGSVLPSGTREFVGGLAGENEGTVKDCSFSGETAGLNDVGGLIGRSTGSVTGCFFAGSVRGEHQVGGIVGQNTGVMFNCENSGEVNTVEIVPESESRFDLSSLSQDDFTDISNIGGVVGENTGIVRYCRNTGSVGYRYTGYNVGGVAGKNSGAVDNCRNSGAVEGRRDVGGIAGQSIPYAAWDLSESKLDELSRAIRALNGLLSSMASKMNTGTSALKGQLQSMSGTGNRAMGAANNLLAAARGQTANYLAGITVDPVTGDITLPSANYAAADTSALTSALNELFAQSASVTQALSDTLGSASDDVRRITGQMSYVFNLVYSLMDDIGGGDLISTKDLSLDEAYDHDEGAIARCSNTGSVRADTCAGGIVGTIAFELSFDMEDTLGTTTYLPTHAERLLFAVVRDCANDGAVQSRNNCAGGIIGRMDTGAVVDCVSRSEVVSLNGDDVGGIAGWIQGSVTRCWARSRLEGGKYVGGIAGLSSGTLSDCRSRTNIARGEEYTGAVAGWAEGAVSGNLYAEGAAGGVDGVSLSGQCEPVTAEALLELEDTPKNFDRIIVRFMVDGESIKNISVPFGGSVTRLPEVDNLGAAYWVWDAADLEHIWADTDLTGHYVYPATTLSSGEDFPLFLVEGEFYEGQSLTVQPYDEAPEEGESVGGYTLLVEGYEGMMTVRMRAEGNTTVYIRDDDGVWHEADCEWDGRYLVFGLPNGGSFTVMKVPERPSELIYAAGGGAALLALILIVRGVAKRRKKAKTEQND